MFFAWSPMRSRARTTHITSSARRNGAWIFHHEGDALPLDRLVLLVDETVLPRDPQGRFDVHACKGVERIVHHVRHHTAEVLDLAVLVRRALHGGQS